MTDDVLTDVVENLRSAREQVESTRAAAEESFRTYETVRVELARRTDTAYRAYLVARAAADVAAAVLEAALTEAVNEAQVRETTAARKRKP